MKDKRSHIEIITPLKESSSELGHLVKLDENRVKEVTEGDSEPRFIVAEIEEGKSSNNVTYDLPFFENLAKQINEKEPVGYLGHKHFQGLDKEDLLPDPQAVWLGAVATREGGKARLIAKGYLMPASEGGKARAWLKRRAINSVSWAGDAVLTLQNGTYHVKEYFLESIDFARKNREGMKGQRLAVVTEMEGSETRVEDESTEKIVGKLTLSELKEYNPGLLRVVKEMGKEEVEEEIKTKLEDQKTDLETKHKKEIDENPDITMMQKIKKALGIADDPNADPEALIVQLLERLDEAGKKIVKNWFNTEILEKKVPNETARKLVGRLIPVTEMQGDYRTEKGIEQIKKNLEDKADELIDNDEEVQTVIKEMGSSRGGLRVHSADRGGENKRSRKDDDGDEDYKDMERRGNLKVEKVRVG